MGETSPEATVLSLQGVSKRYAAVQALRDVTVACRAGEIHALVGENGSGKSTLLGIASGTIAPDEGTVEIAGRRLLAKHSAEAMEHGLRMAYQTYSQVLELTIAENLYLAAPVKARPPQRELVDWARERLADFDLRLDPRATAGSLALAERQLFEVAKALLAEPKVLLLDEPTTALGPGEVERLHRLIVERAGRGVGIVYVSHRLPEVLGVAHRVSVLRDGVCQGTFDAAGMSEDSLVALMIGRPLQFAFPERRHEEAPAPLLEVQGFRGRRFGPVDLTLGRGEIVGIAGAEGNGQDELLRCLAGLERGSGSVRCEGKALDPRTPHGALRSGIVMLSGNRLREVLFPVLSVRTNATIQVLGRLSRGGLLRRARERFLVDTVVRDLKVRTPSIEQPVRFLSGGNQQKVALSRAFLRRDVKVILIEEPTQGVDVRSRFDIYEALREKAASGVGLVVKSSDPLELAGLCDRVLVVSRGRVVVELQQSELNERRIIEAIVGSAGLAPVAVEETVAG